MSKRLLLFSLFVVLAGMVFVPGVYAASDDTNATLRVSGLLTKVDGAALTIASVTGQEVVLRYTEATKISHEGPTAEVPLKYEDLKAGQQVRAYYSNTDKAVIGIIIANTPTANPAP